ncbi:MAG: Xaa-Pro peptidase family protein [Gemmatimonadetes bacterium]|nr:Xaa-Pro peptidase family protein [Gemmatimonadota bacterium]
MTERPVPIAAAPTAEEMQLRLAKVRTHMATHSLDAYVAASPDNVFYLTNFANYVHERPFLLVITPTGPLRFVAPKLEVPHVRSRVVGALEIVAYAEFPALAGGRWEDALRPLIPSGARVGVESTCPLQVYNAIAGEKVCYDAVDDARMVKTAYEIGRIAYAATLISETMQLMLRGAKPGFSLLQFAGGLQQMMMPRILADRPQTNMLATKLMGVFQPPSVSHDPHNFTNIHMVMEPGGPHVAILNCTINGYAAEIERSFFVGAVPDAARKPYEVMMAGRQLALELTVPGVRMSEVDRQVNALFRQAGYGDNLLHRCGHGIGVTGHEGPFLAEGDDRFIEPGMCFTIEPGIYIPGLGGFRHSDTVITTATGNVLLTQGSVALQDLTFGGAP